MASRRLDPRLLAAYRATSYVVRAPGREIAVRIDRRSPALDRLLAELGAGCAVFVTAWNPLSVPTAPAANRSAADRLAAAVAAGGWRALPQEGRGDDGAWPVEPGLLVLDLDREAALDLAQAFGQLAVVYCAAGMPAELLLTGLAQDEAAR